jgi:hypothetical protein
MLAEEPRPTGTLEGHTLTGQAMADLGTTSPMSVHAWCLSRKTPVSRGRSAPPAEGAGAGVREWRHPIHPGAGARRRNQTARGPVTPRRRIRCAVSPGFRSSTPAWSTDLASEVRRRQRSRYAARVSRHWRYRRSARRSDEPCLLALLRSDRRIPVYIACWLGIAGRNE